jgi:hypothetical protein
MLVRRSLSALAAVLFCLWRNASTPSAVAANAAGSPAPRFYAYCVEMPRRSLGAANVRCRRSRFLSMLPSLGHERWPPSSRTAKQQSR